MANTNCMGEDTYHRSLVHELLDNKFLPFLDNSVDHNRNELLSVLDALPKRISIVENRCLSLQTSLVRSQRVIFFGSRLGALLDLKRDFSEGRLR